MKDIFKHIKEIDDNNYLINILYWDLETQTPKDQINKTIDLIAKLTQKSFELETDENFINNCKNIIKTSNDLKLVKFSQDALDNYEELTIYSKEEILENSKLESISSQMWKKSREKNDFSIFAPYLKQGIELKKEYIKRVSKNKNFETNYDYLLNQFEKGLNVKECDEFFNLIKKEIVPFYLEKKKNVSKAKKFTLNFDIQEKLSNLAMDVAHFNHDKGVLKISTHPFSTTISENTDVRMTTRYEINSPMESFYSTLHETGHSLHGQLCNEELLDYKQGHHQSLIVAESISRTYENYIGKNTDFIAGILPQINDITNLNWTSEQASTYLNRLNEVSKIRVESDELSYPIHVLIRYEIEKEIFNNNIDVNTLEELWNRKYKEYLNEEIQNVNEGINQDIHWSSFGFGYFPTYAMGSAYGIGVFNYLDEKYDFQQKLKDTQIKKINKIYESEVFIHGNMLSRKELYSEITNKKIDYNEYINYLKNKFK